MDQQSWQVNHRTTRVQVVGIGSSNGDDQVAWLAIKRLRARRDVDCEPIALSDASRLMNYLACDRLILVDACKTGAPPGTVFRMQWPDTRILTGHSTSSHRLSVSSVLQLAERLGTLPRSVIMLGVELRQCQPGAALSDSVWHALDELETEIVNELREN